MDWEPLLREGAWLAQADEDCHLQEGEGTEAASQTALANSGAALCLNACACPTLCDSMDLARQAPLSLGILQARILEWVAMPAFKGSSQPRDPTQVSFIAGGFFTNCAPKGLPQLNSCVLRTSQVQSLVLEDTHTARSVTWTTTALLPRSSQSGVGKHMGLGEGNQFMWAQIISLSETPPHTSPTPQPLHTILLTTWPG